MYASSWLQQMTTVAGGEFSCLNIKGMLKKLSTIWSTRLKLNGKSKSKSYNSIKAVNIASPVLTAKQRSMELKLRLLRLITPIRIE
jgi:hypothetical protein